MIINQVVSGGGPTSMYREFQIDSNGELGPSTTSSYLMDYSNVRTIKGGLLSRAYEHNTAISGTVNMSSLTSISGQRTCEYMFYYSTNITGVTLSSLTSISGDFCCYYMFNNSGVTSLNLPLLTSITNTSTCNGMFSNSALTSVEMPLLETISGASCCSSMFSHTQLVTVRFPSLSSVPLSTACSYMFSNCSNLQSLWFYALTPDSFGTKNTQFKEMLSDCSGVAVHFPIAIQSTIGSWSDVTGGFAGTNTTVSFDIVTSLTGGDTNTYTRSEKNSTSTATAWKYNDTLYYTSGVSNNTAGVNEPAVGDTIYSDSSCTTAVTTISSIS